MPVVAWAPLLRLSAMELKDMSSKGLHGPGQLESLLQGERNVAKVFLVVSAVGIVVRLVPSVELVGDPGSPPVAACALRVCCIL